jgi:hypothetical protein
MTTNYKKMKKIYLLTLLFAFSVTSCKKSFLDLTPKDQISEANFFQTETQFRQALATSYVTLRTIYNNDFYLSEERSDNADIDNYPISVSQANLDRLALKYFTDDSNNTYNNNMYQYLYTGVSRANTIIGRLPLPAAAGIPDATKNEIRGEAEFLRALFYFKLVQYFGDVPFPLTEVTTADQAFIPRTPSATIYNQMIADLTDAIANLPVPAFVGGKQTGAATKGAATMLLADIYMTQLKYPQAEALLTSLSTMGYSLLPTYAAVFNTANKNSVESLFEIQYEQGATAGQQSTFLYVFLPRVADSKLITNGVSTVNTAGGYMLPTQNLINDYEPGDTRLDASIGVVEGVYNGSLVMTVSAVKSIINYVPAAGKVGRAFDKKVLNTVVTANNTEDDWPVYRYADALLLLAEAQNEQGKSAIALTSLNAVRARAFGNHSHDITTTDQTALRTAIMHERRVELAFEDHRWHDLQRTGTFVNVMNTFGAQLKTLENWVPAGAFDVQPFRKIYGIPYAERLLNPQLTQNPGYTF